MLLRQRVAFPVTPFEHVLIVSANPPTPTLDMVVWLFGIDPHGYRLCHDWTADAFTYVLVNGVLVGTAPSDAVRLPDSDTICTPTLRRAYSGRRLSQQESVQVLAEIFQHRSDGYRRAVDHGERNYDDNVQENLCLSARLNEAGDHLLETAVRDRLEQMFRNRTVEQESREAFAAIIDAALTGMPELHVPTDRSSCNDLQVDWPLWLGAYRAALDALQPRFGMPGELFTVNVRDMHYSDVDRPLGERTA